MFKRHLSTALRAALNDTPVVFLSGARQVGKSTLAKQVAQAASSQYLTLDDPVVLAAARTDPAGFIAGLEGQVVLDEVQRAPDLFVVIKAAVDRDRRPGRFLLTGSANVLLLPRVAENLAGRMEVLTLWPLSEGEIRGAGEGFIDAVFAPSSPRFVEQATRHSALRSMIVRGGFPEAVQRNADRRRAWFEAYVATILQRDVRELANVERLAELPNLLSLLAARTASLLNYSELSRSSGLPQTTLKRYMALLETAFLVTPTSAWSRNLGKRLTKSPKVSLVDTGLAAALVGADQDRLAGDGELFGRLLEAFVVSELRKQSGWSRRRPRIHHFRTAGGAEVDVVLEDSSGHVVGIEVKASATVGSRDFAGLRLLSESLGDQFVRGLLLYGGESRVPFGHELFAVPLSNLWELGRRPP